LKTRILLAGIAVFLVLLGLFFAGTITGYFSLVAKTENSPCYQKSIGVFPYWFECSGKKVTQTVLDSSTGIGSFTVFQEEGRAFWEFSDAKGRNFYSNNFSANSLTLLNIAPDKKAGESIEYFSIGTQNFLKILQETKRLVYQLVKRDALGRIVSTRVFSNSLQGDSRKELVQEDRGAQKTGCFGLQENRLFWLFSKTDSSGNETSALYSNTLQGTGITLASYVAKQCNPLNPVQESGEIIPFERECSENTFFSQGNFAFWIYRDYWNSYACRAASTTEALFSTYLPNGSIKVLTQFARLEQGDSLDFFRNGIDLQGNRVVWIYYSKETGTALYYNCLKGAGRPRIIDNSNGNASSAVTIEKNTVSWTANGKPFSAQLQECPN